MANERGSKCGACPHETCIFLVRFFMHYFISRFFELPLSAIDRKPKYNDSLCL